MGHALMENRNGLIADACLTPADGHAERVAALHMIEPRADRPHAITLGADKAYDAEDFVNELRSMKVTPHVAQNLSGRSSAIDSRTTRHSSYSVSQRIRKRSRGSLRLGQDGRRTRESQISGTRARRLGLHLRGRRLQSDAATEAHGGARMRALMNCKLVGRWRIIEADIWDHRYLDLCGPAKILIRANGRGKFSFGVLQAGSSSHYGISAGSRN
jgi:hypothetical protein